MSNSKICIVTARSINDSPCLEKYRAIIDEPFDIIYWVKGTDKDDCGAENYFPYRGEVPVEGGKCSKVKHYFLLMRFAKKIIKENRYEKLVVYPTHTAWLLRGILRREYKGRYILDIRDYAGESNKLLGRLTSEAVKNSGLCTITSPAYLQYLPKEHYYVVSHNLQHIDSEVVERYRNRQIEKQRPIVLSFVGTVRFLRQQKRLISRLGNDERFELRFIGRGSEALKEYCEEGQYRNVRLAGQFDRKELGSIYSDTDAAINVYGNEDPALVYALSNKLYSAALMGMPVIASPNTFTAEVVEKYHFGYSINLDDPDCADGLFKYFQELDREELIAGCERFLKQVYEDEKIYAESVRNFMNGIRRSDHGK